MSGLPALRPRRRGVAGRDAALLFLLALPALAYFGLVALSGRTFYWGDLTYIHHPWRALPAQMLQQGALPLWNPYAYLGMPMAAQMQSAVWYPGTLPFYLFSFSTGLFLYHVLHFWLCGAAGFLWLRRLGFTRAAAVGGGFALMLWGGMASRVPFLNHLSTLALYPALLLLAGRPAALAGTLALAFLSGYPPMLLGAALSAALLDSALAVLRRRGARERLRTAGRCAARWAGAGALAAALSAVLLLPALELAAGSRRSEGIPAEERLTWNFAPGDLLQFTAPPLLPKAEFSPTALWWKTAYWGFGACAAAAVGLWRLGPGAGALALAYLGGVILLVLGGGNEVSRRLWELLRFVRYPGNMAYLAAPAAAFLIASGLHRLRLAPPWALFIGGELLLYLALAQPTVPRPYFTDAGPLTRVLARELDGRRYLVSPLALQWHRGSGQTPAAAARDLKHRLYGVANMPYRLPAVSNYGEPLVPAPNYDFLDFLFRRQGLEDAARWLPWADIGVVLTRDPFPPPETLVYRGDSLWHLYRARAPMARAHWLPRAEGAALPRGLEEAPPSRDQAQPLEVERRRFDRFSVSSDLPEPGWLYLAEPLTPGWKVFLNGRRVEPVPALRAFNRLPVPAGAWRAEFVYDPASWRAGLAVTLLALGLAAVRGVRRLRRRLA